MNSKGHLYTSLIKSAIRILGVGFGLFGNITIFIAMVGVAEIFGLLEEILDFR